MENLRLLPLLPAGCYGFLQKKWFHREFRAALEGATGTKTSDYAFDLVTGLGDRDSIELFRAIISAKPSETIKGRLPKVSGKRDLIVLLGELKGYTVSIPSALRCFAGSSPSPTRERRERWGRLWTVA